MPYIMVTGTLSDKPHMAPYLGTTVHGLKSEERKSLVQELNNALSMEVASDVDRTVQIPRRSLTLVAVNRIHALFGYDVISHSMTMTNANKELVSFTMYKKTSSGSSSHYKPSHSSSVITL